MKNSYQQLLLRIVNRILFPSILNCIKNANISLYFAVNHKDYDKVLFIPNEIIMFTQENLTDKGLSFIFSISFFYNAGLSGLFQIIRKPLQGIFGKYFRIIPSVINGIGVLLVFWLSSLLLNKF